MKTTVEKTIYVDKKEIESLVLKGLGINAHAAVNEFSLYSAFEMSGSEVKGLIIKTTVSEDETKVI